MGVWVPAVNAVGLGAVGAVVVWAAGALRDAALSLFDLGGAASVLDQLLLVLEQ